LFFVSYPAQIHLVVYSPYSRKPHEIWLLKTTFICSLKSDCNFRFLEMSFNLNGFFFVHHSVLTTRVKSEQNTCEFRNSCRWHILWANFYFCTLHRYPQTTVRDRPLRISVILLYILIMSRIVQVSCLTFEFSEKAFVLNCCKECIVVLNYFFPLVCFFQAPVGLYIDFGSLAELIFPLNQCYANQQKCTMDLRLAHSV